METVLRVTIIYLFIMIGLRILGKREFGDLSPLELICLLLIPEIVSQSIQGEDFSITNGFIGISTLFSLVFITSVIMHRSKRAENLIAGVPTVLVHRGKLYGEIMNKERVTPDEIFAEMHKAGLERLEQVRWAILEDGGTIAIVPEDPDDRHKRGSVPQESKPLA